MSETAYDRALRRALAERDDVTGIRRYLFVDAFRAGWDARERAKGDPTDWRAAEGYVTDLLRRYPDKADD